MHMFLEMHVCLIMNAYQFSMLMFAKCVHVYMHMFLEMHVCLIMNAYQFSMLMFAIKPLKQSLWYELSNIPSCGLTCAILLGHNAIYYGENIKVS